MKHLVIVLVLSLSFVVQAQKNSLLDRSFWKSNPTLATVKLEIEKGNNPFETTSNAFDPIVFAINEGASNDVIKFLLSQKGSDVNKITHDSRTYIFWAANKGNDELMAFLIKKGAKTNLIDSKGYSIATFPAASGQTNTKVYDLALKSGINLQTDVDSEGANVLLLSAPFDKDFALLNYFISKGVSINSKDSNGNSAFNYAAKTGNIATLKSLVEKGVKYDDKAMLFAAQGTRGVSNTIELYNYLESLKIKPTVLGKNGENVLHAIARKEKQVDIINYFISKGVNVNLQDNDGTTPLMNAAGANKDGQVVAFLISVTKDINLKNTKGVSALALAVKNNTPDIVRLFVDNGADLKTIDAKGENIASYLFDSYDSQKKALFDAKLNLLIEKGFDFNKPQENGNTLYHLAVAKNDLTLIQSLERFKIDVNVQNKEGISALHKAAMVAQNDVILKYLISIGAQKDLLTEFKETPYDLASENEFLTKNKISIDFLKK